MWGGGSTRGRVGKPQILASHARLPDVPAVALAGGEGSSRWSTADFLRPIMVLMNTSFLAVPYRSSPAHWQHVGQHMSSTCPAHVQHMIGQGAHGLASRGGQT